MGKKWNCPGLIEYCGGLLEIHNNFVYSFITFNKSIMDVLTQDVEVERGGELDVPFVNCPRREYECKLAFWRYKT